jgi:hypothetical protein
VQSEATNEKYVLRDEPGKTMFTFAKKGKFYGHIVKDRTEKSPAKIVFETPKFDSIAQLNAGVSTHCSC